MPLFSRSYLKCITFLASFEALNIPITYELFCNSPKEGMIKGLWKNHSHESMVCTLSLPAVGLPSSQMLLCSLSCLPPLRVLKDRTRETLGSWTGLLLWGLPDFPILAGDKATWKSPYLSPWKPEAIPTNPREHFHNPSPSPACAHLDRLSLCREHCFSSF